MNEDHFGPTNARLSGVLLLRKYEICCLGAFDDLTRGRRMAHRAFAALMSANVQEGFPN